MSDFKHTEFKAGFQAYLDGKTLRDNPHPRRTKQYIYWECGHRNAWHNSGTATPQTQDERRRG